MHTWHTCPSCGAKSITVRSWMLTSRWRPMQCTNCGALVGLDRAECFRLMRTPLLGTLIYIVVITMLLLVPPPYFYLLYALACFALSATWARFAYLAIWKLPLQVRRR